MAIDNKYIFNVLHLKMANRLSISDKNLWYLDEEDIAYAMDLKFGT